VLNLYLHIHGVRAPNKRLGRQGSLQRAGVAETGATLRRTLFILLVAFLVCLPAGTALANGWAGADPSTDFAVGQLPESCDGAGASPSCIGAAVSYLEQARASLGQGPYELPADFDSLTPAEQAFVLTDLDRVLYGLAPIPGLTGALDADAGAGVQSDDDPHSSDSLFSYYASNWAGGFADMAQAYEAWMYDDGPGSGNEDCTATNSSGCWGHRHDVLWQFEQSDPTHPLAMGAAAATDSSGTAGYAMILGQGDAGYRPAYTYTWSQAVADGANGGSNASTTPSRTPAPRASAASSTAGNRRREKITIVGVRVRGHRVAIRVAAPRSARLYCALTPRRAGRWTGDHFRHCGSSTTYSGVRAGRYRVRVHIGRESATRYLTVG